MNCSRCQDLIIPYALSALEPDEREQVHAHLQTGCVRCNAELAEVQATLAQLPLSLDPVPPPAGLRSRLMKRLEADRTPASDGSLQPPLAMSRRWRWAEPILAGGLAAAVTAGLLWGKIDRQQRELADLRSQIVRQEARVDQLQAGLEQDVNTLRLFASPAVQLVTLQNPAGQAPAKGRVFWDKDREAFHLYASGLKPTSSGRAYEMWFINSDQKKIPAGTFTVNSRGEGSLVAQPPADAGKIAAIAVTNEPAGGSPQPTGQIELAGSAS